MFILHKPLIQKTFKGKQKLHSTKTKIPTTKISSCLSSLFISYLLAKHCLFPLSNLKKMRIYVCVTTETLLPTQAEKNLVIGICAETGFYFSLQERNITFRCKRESSYHHVHSLVLNEACLLLAFKCNSLESVQDLISNLASKLEFPATRAGAKIPRKLLCRGTPRDKITT